MIKVLVFVVITLFGMIVTFLSVQVPVKGIEVLGFIDCAELAGWPFAFTGSFRMDGFDLICPKGYDWVAFFLNWIFWSGLPTLITFLISKVFYKGTS